MARDNFSSTTKETLAKRVGYHCAWAPCQISTIGPHSDPEKSLLLGEAAHISAASKGGPRFDDKITPEQRKALENGVWLCPTHAAMVDKDAARYSVATLKQWQADAEARQDGRLGKPPSIGETGPKLSSNFVAREWQADSINRFHFSARATDVIGREAESAALSQFCDAKPKFQWWLMTGKGGMGKSRLAYELGQELAQRSPPWDWQFLGSDAALKANLLILSQGTWQPLRDTLLIVDYAANVADELRAAIIACVAAASHWPHRLRLLVIERTLEGGWHAKLCNSQSGNDQLAVQESRYQTEPLALTPLSLEQGAAILQAVLARYAAKPVANLNPLLEKLDAEHRPLFILFLADALHEGGEQAQWDSDALIQQVLQREMTRWELQGVQKVDKELLCFATLAGDIDLAVDLPPHVEALVARAMAVRTPPFEARMAIMLHQSWAADSIPKLEPDLLGELFVLETIVLAKNAWEEKRDVDKPLLDAVWATNFGYGALVFISRAVQDFPNHTRLLLLVEQASQFCGGTELHQTVLANVYYNLCVVLGQNGNLGVTIQQFSKLAELSESQPAVSEIALCQASAAVTLTVTYCDAGELAEACALLESIIKLRMCFPANQDIAARQAAAANSLTIAYGNAGELVKARAMLDSIRELRTLFPDKQAIALEQARAAAILAFCFVKAKNEEDAKPIFTLLISILKQYPTHPDFIKIHQFCKPN